MYRTLLALGLIMAAHSASAQTTVTDIHNLLDEVHYAVDHTQPTQQDLNALGADLRAELDVLNKRPARLLCLKAGNAMFYPTSADTGAVVGDSDYRAGYDTLAECRGNLPAPTVQLSCFKRSNGLFYPTKVATGEIVGSTDYRAGFDSFKACEETLN